VNRGKVPSPLELPKRGSAGNLLEMRFLPEWEQRFTVVPRQSRNAHRPLGSEHRLEEILRVRVGRKMAEDHTVSWDGNRWGLLREEVCAGLRGAAVDIERRLDGSHWLRYRGRYLHLRPCPEPVRCSASPSGLRPPGLADTNTETQKQKQTQIPCACRSPLEKTMEADISIWRKTGHFYFALTRRGPFPSQPIYG